MQVPASAVGFNVVLIYTDVLDGTADKSADSNGIGNSEGDMPLVMGHWTGTLTNGDATTIVPCLADMGVLSHISGSFDSKKGYPTVAQKDEYTQYVMRLISATGNTLIPRTDASGGFDTGFDIQI